MPWKLAACDLLALSHLRSLRMFPFTRTQDSCQPFMSASFMPGYLLNPDFSCRRPEAASICVEIYFWKYKMRSLKQTALKPKKAGVQPCPIACVGMWKIHQAVLAQEFPSWDTKFMLHVFHLHVSCMTYLKPTLWVNRRLNPSLQKGCSVRLEGSPVLSMATPKKSVSKCCLGGYSLGVTPGAHVKILLEMKTANGRMIRID